jgi:hypothetical protein
MDAQVIEQDVGRVVDGKKSLPSKAAELFHWEDWFLLNLLECWYVSDLIQRDQVDKEARRLM